MACFQTWRLARCLGPVLLVAACSSGSQHATGHLNDRLRQQLAPDIAAGQATLQPLTDGARVTLPQGSAFVPDSGELDTQGSITLASVVEGLLDPGLMRISIADTSAVADTVRDSRTWTTRQYLIQAGLASSLQPDAPAGGMVAPVAAQPPAGLTITIAVVCPDGRPVAGPAADHRPAACY